MTTPDDLTSTRTHAHRLVEAEFLVGNKDSILSALEGRDREIEALRLRVGWEVAERNRESGARNVATAVDLGAIEARRNAAREWLASDHTAPHVWPEGASYEGGERCLRCGSTVPAGVCLPSRTMQFLDARGLLRDANDDLRALLAEVRRLQNSERTAATLREHHTRRLGIADPETTWGDIIEAARLDGARAMLDKVREVLADRFRTIAEINDLDPAAVVGSGS